MIIEERDFDYDYRNHSSAGTKIFQVQNQYIKKYPYNQLVKLVIYYIQIVQKIVLKSLNNRREV